MSDDGEGLPERLVEFVTALRSKGINVGTGDSVDAAAVIDVLGLEDRERLRAGLASATLRRAGQREAFDATFDIYFPASYGQSESAREAGDIDSMKLRDLLVDAMAAGDDRRLGELAEIAVDRFGKVGEEGKDSEGWSSYTALDKLQPQTLLHRIIAERNSGGAGGDGDFGQRLERDEVRNQIAFFRRLVDDEARRRLAELRGRSRITMHAVRPQEDLIDFLTANKQQLEELRRVVRPLARRLATRLATRRKKRNRGRIDIRKTMRRSMSTGGVPVHLSYAKPHPTRPELVLICDVSGSVSGFSNFTMQLVQAMKGQFSKIRVFAFVNTVDEVTDLIGTEVDDLQERIYKEAEVARWNSSSDYGQSFAGFVENHLAAITPRTSVIILGDARNNYQQPNLDAVHEIAGRAGRTFWLNPEPSASWGLADSEALKYGEFVEMHECRNVDQLTQFVGRMLPV